MSTMFGKRKPPKLLACMTKVSLETVRNKALFAVDFLDEKAVRRNHLPLYECVLLELRESGYTESADYFQDLIYDNKVLIAEDDIGIIVDIRKKDEYIEEICSGLQLAEKEKERGDTKRECMHLLKLATAYAERGKGVIWLAEKFYLAAIAVATKYLVDGGRQKAVCKYHYARFLLDKFPQADTEEAYNIMTEVRDMANGRTWSFYEAESDAEDEEDGPTITVFVAAAQQLHRLLLVKLRAVRAKDPNLAERLSRVAVRRSIDAQDKVKQAEAIVEMGISQMLLKNQHNAYKTFQAALDIYLAINDIKGICDVKMHLSAVLQRLGDHQKAAAMLTAMGSLAMEHGLRRHLGRALHLLGELHLRRGRPELGTEHLAEAFSCFIGFNFQQEPIQITTLDEGMEEEESILPAKPLHKDESEEEAEQSRLMMAVSAGQELMASFFGEIREASECHIARHKIIEWKLAKSAWWIEHNHHQHFICPCPKHNRSPIDVIRLRRKAKEELDAARMAEEEWRPSVLFHCDTIEDIRKLCSSFQKFQESRAGVNEIDSEETKQAETEGKTDEPATENNATEEEENESNDKAKKDDAGDDDDEEPEKDAMRHILIAKILSSETR